MVERWHRTLKPAILCKGKDNWIHHIPAILLGLRTAYKDDLHATPAELVHGTTLQILSEFFDEEKDNRKESDVLIELRESMSAIRPTETTWHTTPNTFIHGDLKTATHVFVRNDSVTVPNSPSFGQMVQG